MKKTILENRLLSLMIIGTMLLAAFAVVPQARAQSPCGDTYVVQPGDWLLRIARNCETSLDALLRANPQIENPSLIFPGQRLVIPSAVIPDTGAEARIEISPERATPGATLTVEGSGFPANTRVRIGPGVRAAEPVSLTTATTDSEGNFTTQITIPSDADPERSWVVLAATQGGGISVLEEFDVVQPAEIARTYTVQPGDTLAEIAARFNTTVNALVRANPEIEDPSRIFPGQELVIPGSLVIVPDTGRRIYVVERGDTLGEIAVRFGTTLDDIREANPEIEDASRIFPGQRITIPEPVVVIPETGRVVYVVQPGDTLSEIAVSFRTTVPDLLEANPEIEDANLIFPRQQITIPSRNQ